MGRLQQARKIVHLAVNNRSQTVNLDTGTEDVLFNDSDMDDRGKVVEDPEDGRIADSLASEMDSST